MLKNEGFLKILLIFRRIHKSHIWHGGAMVKVARGRKGLRSCNRFEELNK